ncbi:MAG: type II toxin-antitoxin system HigB family toxin [Pyrinomonadaceae bacterium]
MLINGYKIISSFIKKHADAGPSLNSWSRITEKASWKNLIEVRQTYPHADAVGICTVFNIKGNHYRLITEIDYRKQIILISKILTHAEYNKEKWKNECGS